MNQPAFVTNPVPAHPPQPAVAGDAKAAMANLLERNRRERFEAAKAALQGLLASTPTATQTTINAEQFGSRAVRYADALIEALNRSTEGAIHARDR